MSYGARIGVGAMVAVIALGVKFMHRSSTGEDMRKAAHRIVHKVDGYSTKPDYYDWLVDEGHDHVFNDSYHMDYSRYHDKSWVDGDQYMDNLFTWMIDQANSDHAKQVGEALAKYRAGQVH